MENLWIAIAMTFHYRKSRGLPRAVFVREIESWANWNRMSLGGYLEAKVR